jgi:hypothetical protein
VEKDVFGFEVAMQDVVIVHEFDCITDLLHNCPYSFFAEPPLYSQAVIERA